MNEIRPTLEIIAPTVEEAIEEGLTKLGLPREQVDIDILDEGTKGLFGLGSRQARVRLVIKIEKEPVVIEETEPQAEETAVEIESFIVEKTEEAENQFVSIARQTVSELLEKMKVSADVTAYLGEPDDDRSQAPVHVDINGQDLSILIGRKAETLNALQYITKLIVGKELAQSVPITVDVEGFRKRRERQLCQLAQRVAEQVKTTGRSQALEPMAPNERRIVHIELRKDPDVYTRSTGEGNHRKVVIYPQE